MISTMFNHHEMIGKRYTNEKCDGISLTVPDQSLSIREILSRSGIVSIGRRVGYDDNPTHEGLDVTSKLGFDIVEADEILSSISSNSRSSRQDEPDALSEVAVADEPKAKAKSKAAEAKNE